MSAHPPVGPMVRVLREASFRRLFAELTTYRMDTHLRQMEADRRRGRILAFVRGLHFSSLLIYEIRDILAGTALTANWGHLIDDTGALCSKECDVIIHRRGQYSRWDGNTTPVMDFRFVPQERAVAVVSCKSRVRSGDIDREYCELMRPFVPRVWLFAECCGPRSADSVRGTALESGYEEFWFVYTWSPQSVPQPNSEGWNEFVGKVLALAG